MTFERNLHHDATEGERRISNNVIMAKVMEIDAEHYRIRVKAAEIESAWIPFSSSRAGPDRTWHAPEPGEQIVLAVPCGDLSQAVYVGSVYQDEYPPPSTNIDESKIEWKDTAFQSYDRETHQWSLDVPKGGGAIVQRVERPPPDGNNYDGNTPGSEFVQDEVNHYLRVGQSASVQIKERTITERVLDAVFNITPDDITQTVGGGIVDPDAGFYGETPQQHAQAITRVAPEEIRHTLEETQTRLTPEDITHTVSDAATTRITTEAITHTVGGAVIEVRADLITLRVGGSVLTISDSGIYWDSTGIVRINGQRIYLN